MKNTYYPLLAIAMLMMLLISACGSAPVATQQTAPPTAQLMTKTAPPTVEQPAQPTATLQTRAPACPDIACTAPVFKDLEALNTYCIQKIPYQNISLPPGIAYEILDTSGEFKCSDSGTVVDGNSIITCTGKQLWTYELKLKNTTCIASDLSTGSLQCEDGFGYNFAQNCCAPVEGPNNATTTIKVNMGACP